MVLWLAKFVYDVNVKARAGGISSTSRTKEAFRLQVAIPAPKGKKVKSYKNLSDSVSNGSWRWSWGDLKLTA